VTMSQWDTVWERARAGQHTVTLGFDAVDAEPSRGSAGTSEGRPPNPQANRGCHGVGQDDGSPRGPVYRSRAVGRGRYMARRFNSTEL